MSVMMMDDRKMRILNAIISDYIETAVPVGSRTITRKYDMGVSPATIRNEMSDLEALGFLDQPHVSAGRVPSEKAYRLYADMLLSRPDDLPPDEDEIRRFFSERVCRMEDVAESAAQVISELTHYTALVLMPGQRKLRISTLQLVPMPRGAALLVIVTDSGIVRDTVIHVSAALDSDALYAISRMLTERFAGRTLSEVQELLSVYAQSGGGDQRVLGGVSELAAQMERQASVDSVAVGGPHNILNYPEYQDTGKARAFLSAVETKEKLLTLLRAGGDDVSVRIGEEIEIPEMRDCSVVSARYFIGPSHRGTVAVVGPKRMPYGRMIGTLSTISRLLTELFTPED